MRCPFCDCEDTRVIDSRTADGGGSIRRRRECPKCKKRFRTFERYEWGRLLVIKKDGRREEFDRKKLREGIVKACQKRPVAFQDIDRIVTELERDLRLSGDDEISSVVIGKRIMDRLIELDEVAYVRFASVYKEFKDVSRFREELSAIENLRERERLADEEKQ